MTKLEFSADLSLNHWFCFLGHVDSSKEVRHIAALKCDYPEGTNQDPKTGRLWVHGTSDGHLVYVQCRGIDFANGFAISIYGQKVFLEGLPITIGIIDDGFLVGNFQEQPDRPLDYRVSLTYRIKALKPDKKVKLGPLFLFDPASKLAVTQNYECYSLGTPLE